MIARQQVIDLYAGIRRDLTETEQVVQAMAEHATDLPHQPKAIRLKHGNVKPGCWSVSYVLRDPRTGKSRETLALAYCTEASTIIAIFQESGSSIIPLPIVGDYQADCISFVDLPSPVDPDRISFDAITHHLDAAVTALTQACIFLLDAPESQQ